METKNIRKRSDAAKIMHFAKVKVDEKSIRLGRVNFGNNPRYSKANGYVMFYAVVPANELSQNRRKVLHLLEDDNVVVAVKAFSNKEGKPRKALFFKDDSIGTGKFNVGDSFRAVDNTKWQYVQVGNDAEIVNEYEYRLQKREKERCSKQTTTIV